jgi:flagellar hook-length control protein FliK
MTPPDLLALVGSALSGPGAPGGEQDAFRATLKLGEIIRGRVVRSLGEGRYAVNFQGQERVVDSTIPFRTDEILHGRVVALGDRVELQRLRTEPAPTRPGEAATVADARAVPATYAELQALVASWPPAEQAALARLVADAQSSEAMLLAAAAVARSGLPGSSALVERVYAALAPRGRTAIFAARSDAVVLESAAPGRAHEPPQAAPAAVAAFAELLKASFDAGRPGREAAAPESGADAEAPTPESGHEGSGAASDADYAAVFFNAQTGGTIAHAVGTIPLIVDGRLVELDIALFGEQRDGAGAMPHGRVVIELDTEHLGHLHIDANLVGAHVHVGIGSDSADAADFIAGHAPALRARIEADGWSVDGLRYEVRGRGAMNGVARIVLEHRVSADSLSRLV